MTKQSLSGFNMTNPLEDIVDVYEAADIWGLSASHVKRLCRDGMVVSKKIGNSYAILKDQPNPKQRERK